MKMLFLTDKFPPSEGGSRVYYYNLCANYKPENVVVLTKKVDGYKGFDKYQKMKIIRRGRPLANWKYYQLPRIILPLVWATYLAYKEKIDVVHCGEFFPGGAIGFILKKLLKKPYVYYVHETGKWYEKFRFQPLIRRMLLKNADRIVAACTVAEEGVKKDIDEGQEKVFKITPGVDYKKFNPEWKDQNLCREFGIEDKKVILTIARLYERKGHDMVIRALPKILAEVPNAIYLVGGRGPFEKDLKQLVIELNLEKCVRFLGFVPQEKLPGLYSICDVFVMINRETMRDSHEGFGMVFTEASSAGKPVIGGRSGGTGDSILDGVTGYRVDPLNIDEIASIIIKVLKDGKLKEALGRNGREWVVKNFDWSEKAKQLEKVNLSIFET